MSPCKKEEHCKAFAIHCGEDQTDYWAAMMMGEWEIYSVGTVKVLCFAFWFDLFDASHTCSFDLLLMLMTVIAV